jgi:hypothetical protein
VIAPRTATVIAGALVVGVTAGVAGMAMMLAGAVADASANGYGYCTGKATDAPVRPVGRSHAPSREPRRGRPARRSVAR